MILTLLIILGIYFICITSLQIGFKKLPKFQLKNSIPKTQFSILIPFRNEAHNLPQLLKSISKLDYPKSLFEVVLINDASQDASEEIVQNFILKNEFSLQLFQNKRTSNSPKKDALTIGIEKANFEWIVTTDADCEVSPDWLQSFDEFIQEKKPVMICGPVIYKSNGSFIENFQQVDGLSLQTVTIGSFGLGLPLLANGANLAVQKTSFHQVNGYEGNNHLASGDDVFLMEKMKLNFPGKVHFLKTNKALVFTKPQKSWKNLIEQRIRWASKTSKQKNWFSLVLGGIVLLINFSMILVPIFLYFDLENIWLYLLPVFLKMLFDYQFINQSARFFNKKIRFWSFPIFFLLYPSILFMIINGSIRGNFSWKGRVYKNQQ